MQALQILAAECRKLSPSFSLFYMGFVLFVVFCFMYSFSVPGVAVALMGVLAIIIVIKPDPPRVDKIIWVVLAVSLFFVEMRAIALDRWQNQADQMKQLIQQQMEFRTMLSQEADHFEITLDSDTSQFANILHTDTEHFDAVLNGTAQIITNERDLERTDYQRVADVYSSTGLLLHLANTMNLENPDNSENLKGHYNFKLQKLMSSPNISDAEKRKRQQELKREFDQEKQKMWSDWQRKLDQMLPAVRTSRAEVVERLPFQSSQQTPVQVADMLRRGALSRDIHRDSTTLEDLAYYVRALADQLNPIFSGHPPTVHCDSVVQSRN